MNQIQSIYQALNTHLQRTFNVPQDVAKLCTLSLNVDETKQAFGDLSTNAAMILAKHVGNNPRQIAQTIVSSFSHPTISKIEIAGPGFLNIFLTNTALDILAQEIF